MNAYPHRPPWPDALDLVALAAFLLVSLGLPLAGYVFMVTDYRAYLRSLRRQLIRFTGWQSRPPDWVQQHTPRCLSALGLTLPCDEAQLLHAYRERVKRLHPDRGGDRKRFLMLQKHFEQAQVLVREAERSPAVSSRR